MRSVTIDGVEYSLYNNDSCISTISTENGCAQLYGIYNRPYILPKLPGGFKYSFIEKYSIWLLENIGPVALILDLDTIIIIVKILLSEKHNIWIFDGNYTYETDNFKQYIQTRYAPIVDEVRHCDIFCTDIMTIIASYII